MAHLEVERRWLITRPDETCLAGQPDAKPYQITQVYLTALPGETRRIRASQTDAGIVYTRTSKRRVDRMSSEEDETIISQTEFDALLGERDPACAILQKCRWCIPFGGRVLEIDLYPFWTNQAILEIELPARDAPFALPDFITVIREITGERSYSNHSLSRAMQKNIEARTPHA